MKVLITTVPFASVDNTPMKLMESEGIQIDMNPLGRKLKESELAEIIESYDALIAGTDPIGKKVFAKAKNLKLISRVGIGLDSVDLIEARRRGIAVTYTPEAPAPAVAEFTIGLMIALLRQIHVSNIAMRKGEWYRCYGRRLEDSIVGIIGAGRIGSRIINFLTAFNVKKILISDSDPSKDFSQYPNVSKAENIELYKDADIISAHLPLTAETRNLIQFEDMISMKKDAILINTSRGGIINEEHLYKVLLSGHLGGVAIDVFEKEPYQGLLSKIDRCILTAHIGPMSYDCRARMELEAAEEVIRLTRGEKFKTPVPDIEYQVKSASE